MRSKIELGLLLLALTVGIFVVRSFGGVDPDKPLEEYPQSEGIIESVEKHHRIKIGRRFRKIEYYELRLKLSNDSRVYFFRSPHEMEITWLLVRIHRGNLAEVSYQERMDEEMHRIMNLLYNGSTPIAFDSVVREARKKDRILWFVSVFTGLAGVILVGIGIEDKHNAKQTVVDKVG